MTHSRALVVVVLLLALPPLTAHAWDRGSLQSFATLPAGTSHPEGIAVDRSGNVWVADFDVTKSSGPGDVLAFRPDGKLLRGRAHLLVTMPLYVKYDQPEVAQ